MAGHYSTNLQHAILPLFSAILFLGVGIIVFFLNKQEYRKPFLRFCYTTFHWQFSWFILFYVNDARYADLIAKIGYSGIIFIPIAYYEAVCTYLGIKKNDIKIFYSLGLIFLAFLWFTNLFVSGTHKYSFGRKCHYPESEKESLSQERLCWVV